MRKARVAAACLALLVGVLIGGAGTAGAEEAAGCQRTGGAALVGPAFSVADGYWTYIGGAHINVSGCVITAFYAEFVPADGVPSSCWAPIPVGVLNSSSGCTQLTPGGGIARAGTRVTVQMQALAVAEDGTSFVFTGACSHTFLSPGANCSF